MEVAIIADGHYYMDSSNNVYVSAVYGYEHWSRYLSAFDHITVIARGEKCDCLEKDKLILSSGNRVEFRFVYDFRGIKDMAANYSRVGKQLSEYMSEYDCAIIRIPSPLSRLAVKIIISKHIPFLCEMAADPAENYDNIPFSRLVKSLMKSSCKYACLNANGVAYVTTTALQEKYPSFTEKHGESKDHFDISCPDVNLTAQFTTPAQQVVISKNLRMIHVANVIDGQAKGHYICLEILQLLLRKGIEATLSFIGDGPEVPRLKDKCTNMHLENNVHFCGRLANADDLFQAYTGANLFLLPSKTEGVPRSLIEAMACGLVCYASDVGGIPELLEPRFLCAWKDSEEFSNRIAALNQNDMILISKSNKKKSREFYPEVLQAKRDLLFTWFKQYVEGSNL